MHARSQNMRRREAFIAAGARGARDTENCTIRVPTYSIQSLEASKSAIEGRFRDTKPAFNELQWEMG